MTHDAKKIAIIILSDSAFAMAEQLKAKLTNAQIYGFADRVTCCDEKFTVFSHLAQTLYKQNIALITCCATGIIIRALSPILHNKHQEPPVICISEDGQLIVPLLGAANGANRLAQQLSTITTGFCAITSNGERRLGINLLDPPKNLELANPQHAKSFISHIINGQSVHIIGTHSWLDDAILPLDKNASLNIQFIDHDEPFTAHEKTLIYRKKINQTKGKLSIIGLGPGDKAYRSLSAQKTLEEANDILGYDFYIKLAAPFHHNQIIHQSDNRQELERAQHAIQLAAKGRAVAMLSSGDPGVFAMAAAVFEVVDTIQDEMPDIEINVEPGITSAFAAAAQMGAPLGHDFALISLSDNLKPFDIIAKRLTACCQADMVLALYNPISKARHDQIHAALNIIKSICPNNIPVGLGHDIARPTEKIKITTLDKLDIKDITSRTVIIIGSSRSKIICANNKKWFYTPRNYKPS